MNRETKKNNGLLPTKIDSYGSNDFTIFAEYDGFLFEARSEKALINQILKYIFSGGEKA